MNTKQSTKLHSNVWRKFFSFILFACAGVLSGHAQNVITGTVLDENGEVMPGVSVVTEVNGELKGTSTDIDGKYSISVEIGNVLEFSSIGYVSQKVVVRGNAAINVVLEPDTKLLDEVVVVGYGSVKKKDILGSVATVRGNDLAERNTGGVVESMRGLTPGVKITSSGQPGSNASIVIRGLGSLTNNNPLFIIDGSYGGSEMGVNVEDIESIQVLKDASSAAIYGSRAANGVVIITTKQGKAGRMKVKFDGHVTLNWMPRYDLMDAETYKLYDDRAYAEAMLKGVESVKKYQNHYDGNTDWQNEMVGLGILQNYNVSFSGGRESLKYYTSVNHMNDKGAVGGTGYRKYGFRVNTSGKKGVFSYGENLFYTKSSRNYLQGNPWAEFIGTPPTIPVLDPAHPGGFGYGDVNRANSYGINPVAHQKLVNDVNDEEYLYANIYGQLNFIDMFEAKVNVSCKSYFGTTDTLRKKGSWTMGQGDDAAYIGYRSAKHTDFVVDQTYRFYHVFGKHDINAMLGMTYNKFHEDYRWITKLDPLMVGDKYITSLDSCTGTTTAGGSYGEAAMISYFGRINYAYDNRYLIQLTGRRDGTSRLPKKTRWGNFFSASLGWRISGEEFFNVPEIDELKLRVNYGTLGNSSIGFWDYQSIINTAPRAIMGADENQSIGMIQSKLTNNDLAWEKKTTANVGLDLGALGQRFNATLDYFYSKSDDLLLYLPILQTSGNEGGNPAVNAGSLSNQGFEMQVGWNDTIGDFNYHAGLNMSYVKNKIHDLGYKQTVHYTSLAKSEIGQSLGMFYLYKMNGIFQNQDEIDSHVNSEGIVIQPDARPGDIIYDDYNDDGKISSEDRQIVGNPWPKLEMGFSFGVAYKGFSFDFNGYGRFGQTVYNGAKAAAGDFSGNQNNFNSYRPWTQECPSFDTPRMVYGDSRNSRGDQSRWLEDGSFFRISDMTFAYTLPSGAVSKIYFENIKFSVTLKNLVTFTKYSGLDPEFADYGVYEIGVDHCSFPNPRSVQFGLTFTF